MAWITIGIPFYNCERTIGDAIRSVFAQRFEDWELILLDDGSTDKSMELVNGLKDPRVRVINDGHNKGIGARRAEIVDLAEGKYLAWTDADDLMHPSRLEEQFRFLEQNRTTDIVDTCAYLINEHSQITGKLRIGGDKITIQEAVKKPLLCNPATLGRIATYRDHPIDRNLKRVEDWEFWIRAINDNNFAHMPHSLCYKREIVSDLKLSIKKELRELFYINKIILRHGPRILGWPGTSMQIIRYSLRPIIRGLMNTMGLQRFFLGRLRSRISGEEKSIGEVGLKEIFSTCVPGISLSLKSDIE